MSKKERFIIIGLDPSVISEILIISKNHNPNVDICGDFSSFDEKRKNHYDLYIFSLTSLDKGSLDFLQFLQKKESKDFHVIAIMGSSLSEEAINQIKNTKIIDEYVFNPLKDNELERAFNKLYSKSEKSIKENDRLFELKLKYDRSIGEKLKLIEELIQKTKVNPENINTLKSEIHKISGTAGSFGYSSVSSLCKDLERELAHKIADGTYQDEQFLKQLDQFFEKLKTGFQEKDDISLLKSFVNPTIVSKPLLYIVDDDVHFLSLIERIKDDFFFEVIVEFDPEKAMNKLSQEGFNPTFLIVSETFGTSQIKGFDLIVEEQRRKTDLHAQFFGLLLAEENIDIRMEALQKNINYIFRKPISAHALLNSIAGVLENKITTSPKVLIVDDDKDFSEFVTVVLAEIGVSSFAISESSYLFKALEEYRPDILLLDMVLPKYDGLNLLKTLRQDISYKHLIIVIVTGTEQAETSSKAYAAKVDDILFKPIDPHVLQKRILNLMDRRVYPTDQMTYSMTGLPTEKEMIFDLQEHLKKADYLTSYLVLFEIQNFSNWINENGYSSIKDLLIYISNHLTWISDYTLKCYLFDTTKFALIIEGLDSDQVKNKMHRILSEIVSKEKRWPLRFNCSIVPISKGYVEASKILSASNEALIEASNLEPNVIKMATHFPKGETYEKKEIVIVDSDVNLLRILKNAFSAHGIIVHTFSEGGDALNELLTYGENRLPALIIIERKLHDMDGMDLFVKLKIRFRKKIPCFILTLFSSDKDVSEGLSQGVLEYVLKPFNISILVQKALRIINQA